MMTSVLNYDPATGEMLLGTRRTTLRPGERFMVDPSEIQFSSGARSWWATSHDLPDPLPAGASVSATFVHISGHGSFILSTDAPTMLAAILILIEVYKTRDEEKADLYPVVAFVFGRVPNPTIEIRIHDWRALE